MSFKFTQQGGSDRDGIGGFGLHGNQHAVVNQPDASAVMTVVAVEPLRIDGIDVAPEEPIEIDADLAADLLERGLVAPVPETPAEPESKPDQPVA